LLFAMCVAFHAPATHIFLVTGLTISAYFLDWLYCYLLNTFKLTSCFFTRIENGVQLRFKNPHGFPDQAHGYVYLLVPFINQYEWHPFSVYPHQDLDGFSCVHIHVVGDWTRKLFKVIERETQRPAWVQGPFVSPFSTATDFDNLILVASGVGITPALAVMHTLKEERRVNLVWVCRDASMVEFFLNTAKFDDNAWTLIFYTGKENLNIQATLPPVCFICTERPTCHNVVLNIVYSIESQDLLPEQALPCTSQSSPFTECPKSQENLTSSFNLEPSKHLQRKALGEIKDWKNQWQTLYCGSNKHIIQDLKDVCAKIGIRFRKEAFDW